MLMAWWRRRRQAAIVTLQRDRSQPASAAATPGADA
jgi:hypothetical protein